jgi:hypothetical protein
LLQPRPVVRPQPVGWPRPVVRPRPVVLDAALGAVEAHWFAAAHVSAVARVAAVPHRYDHRDPHHLKKFSLDGSVSNTSHPTRLGVALPVVWSVLGAGQF